MNIHEDERQKRKREQANARQRKRRARQKILLEKAAQEKKSSFVEKTLEETPWPFPNFERFKESQYVEENNNDLNSAEGDINSEDSNDDNNSIFYDAKKKSSESDAGDSSADEDDDSSSGDEDFTFNSEVDQLRDWAIDCGISQNNLDKLLAILRCRLLTDLPKSSKTFLGTSSANYSIKTIRDTLGNEGDFVYLGIEKGLKSRINEDLITNNSIELVINIDGMPLSKSGFNQFWPILVNIFSENDIYEPFPIAIFHGNAKPNLDEFLNDFIIELNTILEKGLEISPARILKVTVKCFVCDTPARSYIKAIIGHGGYYACERCIVKGDRFVEIEENGIVKNVDLKRTVYPETNCELRNDSSFRSKKQKKHHHNTSPITRITPPIDIIFSFILDFMHLCCLGFMEKLLQWWLSGKGKLKVEERNELGRRMELLKTQATSEFHRKPRSTKFFSKWKATEFRFFLLYCGPVVLKNLLSKPLYRHFLLLHTACRILCCKSLCLKFRNYAKNFLVRFFESLDVFYGFKSKILNFHHLIHLPDDVEKMNCSLSQITAFPFENLLGKIKRRLLRSPVRPLAQVCRRLHEEDLRNKSKKPATPKKLEILETKSNKILKIKYQMCEISTKSPDNVVLLKNNVVLEVHEILNLGNELKIKGNQFTKKKSLFEYPVNSKHLKMWEVESELAIEICVFPLELIECKMIKMSVNLKNNDTYEYYVVPLLH